MKIKAGKLLLWTNRKAIIDAGVTLHWGERRIVWVRFGKSGWRSFTERYQGTRGIPVRWHYFLNGWLSVNVGAR